MLIALLFRDIFAFRLCSEAWLLTKGGPARSTEVVAIYLYQEAFSFNAFGPAAATAWIMALASLLLAVAIFDHAVNGEFSEVAALGLLWSLLMSSIATAFYLVMKRRGGTIFGM